MKPFFSVIIPLFNKEKLIQNTLQSVMDQSFQDFEIIIVNDGSTDDSEAEVTKFKDDRIKLFTIENQGVSYARNYGISKSNSEFMAFLDADDYWYPNHLEDLKLLITNYSNCGIYAKAYECVFYGKPVFKSKFLDLAEDFSGVVRDYFHHSLINQIAWTSAVVIPKKILDTYGGFDVELKAGEDTDLWTRIALQEKVAFDSKVSAQKIITASQDHLSQSVHTADKINLLDRFIDQEQKNASLKKYMDYNRFSIAIERKLVGDIENFKKIKKQIHPQSLNQKQKLLLKMPKTAVKSLKRLQSFLLKHQIYLSAFR